MKVSTEIDNNFGYEKITQLVDNIPLKVMEPRPIVFKEWRDTMTFSNLKSTHCTLLKKSLYTVSKVQREQ